MDLCMYIQNRHHEIVICIPGTLCNKIAEIDRRVVESKLRCFIMQTNQPQQKPLLGGLLLTFRPIIEQLLHHDARPLRLERRFVSLRHADYPVTRKPCFSIQNEL